MTDLPYSLSKWQPQPLSSTKRLEFRADLNELKRPRQLPLNSIAPDSFQKQSERKKAPIGPLNASAVALQEADRSILNQPASISDVGDQEFKNLQAERFKERGNEYYLLRHYDLAISEYLKSLYADPAYTDSYYNLGKIYTITGDNRRAIEAYRRLLIIKPEDYETRVLLAQRYADNQQYNAALEQYETVLNQKPNFDPASRNRQYLLNKLQAIEQPELAGQIFNQKAQQTLGQAKSLVKAYYQQHHQRESIKLLEKLSFQFSPTEARQSGNNMAEYDNKFGQYGIIRIRPELAYANHRVLGAYIIHEMIHALDQDPLSSVIEEQDAYRKQAQFWIQQKGQVEDPNLDLASDLYTKSVDLLDQEVRRSYGDDDLLPEKSPGHGLPKNAESLLEYNRQKLNKLKSFQMERIKSLIPG